MGEIVTPRDKRWLLAGATIVCALLLFGRAAPLWLTWTRDGYTDADQQMRAAGDADAIIARSGATRDTLAARNARYLALAPALIPATTPADARASLASLLSAAATVAGVKLGAVQLLADADTGRAGTFRLVRVRADYIGDTGGLADFLVELERGRVRLRVRELNVAQTDPASPANRVEVLRGDLVVEGLALITGGKR